MNGFSIFRQDGQYLGMYRAQTAREALDAMACDAGYECVSDMDQRTGEFHTESFYVYDARGKLCSFCDTNSR